MISNFILKTVPRTIVQASKRNFSVNWGPRYERPLVHRVMSTNTFPVPYYQRIAKSYPIREQKDKTSLLLSDFDVDDSNWYQAMELLKETVKGRQVVDWVENHLESNTFVLVKTDVGKMAKAYVDDIVGFLDVANKENKRILNKHDLL
mmetsp:Transcript_48407/g.67258  ORF Transcript_48407/g.67258 Transcript_48407/m.67258 type:complete len:148 (-) Transcript_48407:110-553(-)